MKIKKLVANMLWIIMVASYGVAPIAVAVHDPSCSVVLGECSSAWMNAQNKAKIKQACFVDNHNKYNACVKIHIKNIGSVDHTAKAEKQMKTCVINLYKKSKKCK
jgi:hypothetical protein